MTDEGDAFVKMQPNVIVEEFTIIEETSFNDAKATSSHLAMHGSDIDHDAMQFEYVSIYVECVLAQNLSY